MPQFQDLDTSQYLEDEILETEATNQRTREKKAKEKIDNVDRAIFLGFFCISLVATLLISGAI